MDLRKFLFADSNCECSARLHEGREPSNTRPVERRQHEQSQTSRGRRQWRSECVVAVDVRTRRHERDAMVTRTTQNI